MTAKAIGALQKDFAEDPQLDVTTILELADRGFTLVEMLSAGDEIDPDCGTCLLARILLHRAAVVVIAEARHMPAPDGRGHRGMQRGHIRPEDPGHVQYPEE
ncbi:hypothetical protein IU427_06165 [Nocardia beijingensis]|uniref:hypothetical protein n=1 Tax=Nocardia TaxID=1817 RepID=UPI00135B5BA3|nr:MULTISPECIES: hypothetical protein [Nocardia]MBF6464769.1 hypothetical protein [Nocardia beijingensis]